MPQPSRILMTADAVGGVWTYAIELSRELTRRGKKVALATMGPGPSAAQRRDAERAGVELFESAWKLEWMDEPWSDVEGAGDWLLDLERRWRPDLVHLNGYCHGALPFRSPVLVVGHSCVLSWWRAVRGGDAPPEWDRYREAVKRGIAGAREVVAPSSAMLRSLEEHYGPIPRKRIVPNGRAWQHRTGLRKEPLVFSSGRLWDEAKNVAVVQDAARRISWPVYIAGPDGGGGSDRAGSQARFLGRLSPASMEWWLDRASIYVLPAKYEPFGLSILEAALAGCALVLGDIASLREIWGDTARFVDPVDVTAIGAAIEDLIAHPERRIELANLARCRALEFTPGRMAEGYLAAYHSIVS